MIRKLNLNSLFLTMAILLLAVSCDKEELSESVDFHEHTENNKSIYETIDVDNLPDLREELNTISQQSFAKNDSSSSEANFALFENYDVLIASIDSTTTYTLPVIQPRENNRQFSNLVLTYTNDVLTKSFILKYEGTQEYLNQRVIDKDIPFSGIMSLIPVLNTTDLFAKTLVCQQVNITYCRWTEDQEHNVWHQAGSNCNNSSLMVTVPATVCTNESLTFDDGRPNNGGGGSDIDDPTDPTSGDDGGSYPVFGGVNEYPIDGTYTHPVANPPCEEDPLSLTEGGCYDPYDDELIALPSIVNPLTQDLFETLEDEEKNYINHPDQNQLRRQIDDFLLEEEHSEPAKDFAIEAIKAKREDEDTVVDLEQGYINNLTGRAKEIFNLLLASDPYFVNHLIENNFNSNKESFLILTMADLSHLDEGIPAFTDLSYNVNNGEGRVHNIRIDALRINSLTNIEIAQIIIHEMLHTELMERSIQLGLFTQVETTTNTFIPAVSNLNINNIADAVFAYMVNNYIETSSTSSEWNHNAFTIENYRARIVEALLSVHENLSGESISLTNYPQNVRPRTSYNQMSMPEIFFLLFMERINRNCGIFSITSRY